MKQLFIHFKRERTLIDVNKIVGVYTEKVDGKDVIYVDTGSGDGESYELKKYTFSEVLFAIEHRESNDAADMRILEV